MRLLLLTQHSAFSGCVLRTPVPCHAAGKKLCRGFNHHGAWKRYLSVEAATSPISSSSSTSSSTTSSSNTSSAKEIHVKIETLTDPKTPGASVSLLTFNRPPANAMGRTMLHQLQEAIAQAEETRPRCLVLCSALAPKVFSAGADLKERATMTQEEASHFVSELRATFQRLSRLPMPVVAAVDGVAVGGGSELALAADIRIASRKSIWGFPETSLAIIPGAGGTQRLPRLIGEARAKELIFTATRIDSITAAQYGLVQHVVHEPEKVLDRALAMAWKIARNGPIAVQAAKWALDHGLEADDMKEALEIEREAYAKVLPTFDRLEGLVAFKEARNPEYKGW